MAGETWASQLRLLHPGPGPREVEENGWIDGLNDYIIELKSSGQFVGPILPEH